jgi:hypothetical protein
MVTKRQIEIYKKYGGFFDGINYADDEEAQQLFDNNDDWSIISNIHQDIYLVENKVCSKEYSIKTLRQIELAVDKDAIPLLWTLE